ncbi:serine acetyltransferase [Candidatus Woesearchaeota archaeon]|nr:serine acetyltransferase [Candidatus Woesearchaeota archaeon]
MIGLYQDLKSIVRNDPAVKGKIRILEVILYPSIHALIIHRLLAYPLYKLKIPFIPRLLSQISRFLTGIEIHPGAKISPGLFIDHGMGVVIGETAVIGENCVLFHGVTLGGTGKETGKRHPTLKSNVVVGANATLLGPITIGENVKVGAETVIINKDVPPNCTVVGAPGVIVRKNNKKVKVKL